MCDHCLPTIHDDTLVRFIPFQDGTLGILIDSDEFGTVVDVRVTPSELIKKLSQMYGGES